MIKITYINNMYMNIEYIFVSSGFLQSKQIFTMVRNDEKKLYIVLIKKIYNCESKSYFMWMKKKINKINN